jgi:hypothetical protein
VTRDLRAHAEGKRGQAKPWAEMGPDSSYPAILGELEDHRVAEFERSDPGFTPKEPDAPVTCFVLPLH